MLENANLLDAVPTPPVEIVPDAPAPFETLSPAVNSAPDPLIVEGPT